MHKFTTSFVPHFQILGSTSWIWTSSSTEELKFENPQNETHMRASILNTAPIYGWNILACFNLINNPPPLAAVSLDELLGVGPQYTIPRMGRSHTSGAKWAGVLCCLPLLLARFLTLAIWKQILITYYAATRVRTYNIVPLKPGLGNPGGKERKRNPQT